MGVYLCHRGGKSSCPYQDSNPGPLADRASTLTTGGGQWLQMTGALQRAEVMHQSFATTAPTPTGMWVGDSGANVWGSDLLSSQNLK